MLYFIMATGEKGATTSTTTTVTLSSVLTYARRGGEGEMAVFFRLWPMTSASTAATMMATLASRPDLLRH
uniref:Uncharacterized protein n=1 Tax=Arundo donax TaxID=35708 RepID=A0A0A9GYK4_ARUDO